VVDLLAELRSFDVHVAVDGEGLRLNAPTGILSEQLCERVRQRKKEILDFLRSAQRLSTQQRAVVPLCASGALIPIFAVAGHNGDVFCYRAIARYLGPEQPFFGLQPPGLEETTAPSDSVHGLARYFATQIREFYGRGPVTIAGFCAGGTVAFELARQLIDAGHDVRNLMLFGSPFSKSYRRLPQFAHRVNYLARRSIMHGRALLNFPVSQWRQYFVDRLRALARTSEQVSEDPVVVRRRAVGDATMEAVRRYDPDPVDVHLDLMLPCHAWKRSTDAPLRWKRLVGSTAEYVGPEGCDGDDMLLQAHAPVFAAFVKQAQKAAEVRGPS
jgi:thioesterase domain-containing protein